MNKVFVEDYDYLTCNMWERNGFVITEDIDEADIVCFIGGADVSPELYGHENTMSYCDPEVDMRSMSVLSRCWWDGRKILVGICRGGQFLNVMHGGTMRQHVDGHGTEEGHFLSGPQGPVLVRSDHHQGMLSNPSLDPIVFKSLDNEEVEEIIIYNNVLCFQPHPEYMPSGSETERLFFYLIGRLV